MSKQKFQFEQSLQILADIVDKLEKAEISVEESLKLYEQGMNLIATCQKYLDYSKGRVELIKKNSTGTLTTESFDSD